MDLKQHVTKVQMLTDLFCLMPTISNLKQLKAAVTDMETTCRVLLVDHPDQPGKKEPYVQHFSKDTWAELYKNSPDQSVKKPIPRSTRDSWDDLDDENHY
jgi:hypothetical protein